MNLFNLARIAAAAVSIVAGSAALAAGPTTSDGAGWTVDAVMGDVAGSTAQGAALPVREGSALAEGAIVSTGADGSAILTRGGDTIALGANATLELTAARGDGWTRVTQRSGAALYDVLPTGRPHFEVTTPYLVSVVKGTSFEIAIMADRTEVIVTTGVVAVRDQRSGAEADVSAGRSASVRADHTGVSVAATPPTKKSSVARSLKSSAKGKGAKEKGAKESAGKEKGGREKGGKK